MKVYVKWEKDFKIQLIQGLVLCYNYEPKQSRKQNMDHLAQHTTYNCNDEDSVAIIFNCNDVVAQISNKLAECVTRDVNIHKKLSDV